MPKGFREQKSLGHPALCKEYIILPAGWYHLRHGYLHLCLPFRKNGALLEVFVKNIIITGYVSPGQENWFFLTKSGTVSWSLEIFCYEMPSS
jgi:hypothetical protein